MTSNEDLAGLGKRKAILFKAIRRHQNFLNIFDPQVNRITDLEFREKEIQKLYSDMCEIMFQIELLVQEGSEAANELDQERESVENLYYGCLSDINYFKSCASSLTPQDVDRVIGSGQTTFEPTSTMSFPIRLPQIPLPTFDGMYEQWLEFHNIFESLIHNEKSLSKIQKFQYLKNIVKGSAKDLISSLELSEHNYDVAWKLLCDRYHKNNRLIQSHISELFNLTKITKPESNQLLNLHNSINKHTKALEQFELPVDKWDVLLLHMFTSKLDRFSLRMWEEECAKKDELPTMKQFMEFLLVRCNVVESMEAKSNEYSAPSRHFHKGQCLLASKGLNNNSTNNISCFYCRKDHFIHKCPSFLEKTPADRWNVVKDLKLCTNCLAKSHMKAQCTKSSCSKCNLMHNTLLHRNDRPQVTLSAGSSNDHGTTAEVTPSANSLITNTKNTQVVLATAVINIQKQNGSWIQCRVVLDGGSMINLISEELANLIGRNQYQSILTINGVGSNETCSKLALMCPIKSRVTNYQRTLTFHVVPIVVSQLPKSSFLVPNSMITEQIKDDLADPSFNVNGKIDALIGAEVFYEIFLPNRNQALMGAEVQLYRTQFGYIFAGNVSSTNFTSTNCLLSFENQTYAQPSKKTSEEDAVCEDIFCATIQRSDCGKFIVQLPFRDDPSRLGNTFGNALMRFLSSEKRLEKFPIVKEQYKEFISEYLNEGHMEEIPIHEIENTPNYYLPHHAVLRDSVTTALRVVFDASCKGPNKLSLNDILMPGPSLLNEVFDILISFRRFQFAVMGDVSKMYRMILVDQGQWDMQRILWRDSPHNPLKHYRLKTVTYGTSSAPFLAIRCLHQIADEIEVVNPKLASLIRTKFFMDDFVFSAKSEAELLEVQKSISNLLAQYGFRLRKWCSNSRRLLDDAKLSSSDPHIVIEVKENKEIKALGMEWHPEFDHFQFHVKEFQFTKIATKRAILADVASVYDPLGLLVPVLLTGKLFVQQLWKAKIGWDEPMDSKLFSKWQKYRSQLPQVNDIRIFRHIGLVEGANVQLHGFADASTSAYGCCIYVVIKGDNGAMSNLLCAKSRIAPNKPISIPCLELKAAVLLTELVEKVNRSFQLNRDQIFLWSDSMIVIAWLSKSPLHWKKFVSNRVSLIQNFSDIKQWSHVPSEQNPADMISRGILASQLLNNKLWWEGPRWLSQSVNCWPSMKNEVLDILPEQKVSDKPKTVCAMNTVATISQQKIASQFSTWTKLTRITAWIRRFYSNVQHKMHDEKKQNTKQKKKVVSFDSNRDYLKVEEIKESQEFWIKISQQQTFQAEISSLTKNGSVQSKSKLMSLVPFLDNRNLLRAGGRLQNSDLPESSKHPIILPHNSHVTILIFRHFHEKYGHVGPSTLLALIRTVYWPTNGRNLAKRIVHECVKCFRSNPKPATYLMGQLPSDRVKPNRPFTICGVDIMGPVYVQPSKRCAKIKAYVAVFVCFSVKACHLELITDLSTAKFLNAFKRFVSRRGICRKIYSDNGANFVGARRELKKLFYDYDAGSSIADLAAREGVEWHLNPPGSPHFGGLCESAVKATKYHFNRIASRTPMTYEELHTTLCLIEACLNSRPLTYLSTDPSEFSALTPAHFLVGGSLVVPEELTMSVTVHKRWKIIQRFVNEFWKTWSRSYLTSLQQRSKWLKEGIDIKTGTLVLVQDDNLPPTRWKLGRIIEVHPGKDGKIRVATVRLTNKSTMKRSLTKICPLPIGTEEGIPEVQLTLLPRSAAGEDVED